jgi:hypothetical protein
MKNDIHEKQGGHSQDFCAPFQTFEKQPFRDKLTQ